MQNFLVIAIFLSLGALSRRLFSLPDKAPLYINQLIINISLPAVILLKLPELPLDRTVLLPMLVPWLVALPLVGGTVLVARRLGWSRDVIGALVMLVLYGNTSYFGFPMVRALFGDAGMPYAIMFDQLGNFVMLAVFAPLILAHFNPASESVAPLVMVRRIFSFPSFIALIAALLLNGVHYPAWISAPLGWLSLLLAPLAMFIVGLQMQWNVPTALRQPLFFVLGMRLLVSPLLALLLCLLSGHTDLSVRVTVFEAAMPPMVTAAIMAMSANLAPRLCTAAVGFGLGASLLTLPVWYFVGSWLFG